MAVIRPLTNTYHNTGSSMAMEFSDLSTKTLYNVAEEDECDLVRYNPPLSPHMMAHGQIMPSISGPMKEVDEVVEYYPPVEHMPLPQSRVIPQQRVITDHLLLQYNSDFIIPELNDMDMIIPPSPVGGGEGFGGRSGSSHGRPVYHQAHLIQQHAVLPLQLDLGSFDDEEHTSHLEMEEEEEIEEDVEVENEQFGLLHGYIYDNALIHEEEEDDDLVQLKLAMENSMALMPPSPFRDTASMGSPFHNASPVSESILCAPPNYASVILKDYTQSSTL